MTADGARKAIRGARRWVVETACERALHVRTQAPIMDDDYVAYMRRTGLPAAERVGYLPSEWLTLPRILRNVGRDDVFLDVGCGRGRTVIEAAAFYRFGRVLGVELAPGLAAQARENVARAGWRLRSPVSIIEADAVDYEIEADVNVVYLFNPFRGAVFAAFFAQLLASLEKAPRDLRLIYVRPREEELILASGKFVRAGIGRSLIRHRERHEHIVLYETTKPG